MFNSKAYTVQMNLDVPDSEKRTAEKAVEVFESLIGEIKIMLEELEQIYVPFSKRQSLDSDEVVENRHILNKFLNKLKRRFDEVTKKSDFAISLMSEFSTDSTVEELMSSFSANKNELKKQMDYLLSIFSNLNSPDFKDTLLSAIDSVRKQSSQLKQLINDRVLDHIDTNILAKNWDSLVNDKFQDNMKSKVPLVVQLYNERQKALK